MISSSPAVDWPISPTAVTAASYIWSALRISLHNIAYYIFWEIVFVPLEMIVQVIRNNV